MKTIKFRITGTMPLMLNNPQTVNPFNEFTKKLKPLTSKRTKTDDDMLEIYKLKFLASLYTNAEGKYILPAEHIANTLIAAGKERKLGQKLTRSMQVICDSILEFKDSNKTPEQLYKIGTYVDIRAVGIKNSKIPTARAIIPEWSLVTEVWYDETQLDKKDIKDCLEIAGLRYGVGTFRKVYGRFKAEEVK